MFFSVYLSCAFDPNEIGGTYDIVNDDFGVVLDTEVTVVAGPGANQYTIQNAFGHGFDLSIDVDPVTGESISDRQQTWSPQAFGLPAGYGKGYAEVKSGFSFSCSGTLTFNLEFTVDIGTYGDGYNMTFQRR